MKISQVRNEDYKLFREYLQSKLGEVSNDEIVRNYIKFNMGYNYGPDFLYSGQIGTKSLEQIKSEYRRLAAKNLYSTSNPVDTNELNETNKVDITKLKKLSKGTWFANIKRENELYSGARLTSVVNGLDTAKQAGIKTIVALEGNDYDNYDKQAKEAGLNYIALKDIGNKTLNIFSIIPTQTGGKVIYDLIREPEKWATQNADGTIKPNASKEILDVQNFIDILDGKDKNLPLPIYYGCSYGTTRTYAWTTFYNILRNADRTKPLTDEKTDELFELAEDLESAFKL